MIVCADFSQKAFSSLYLRKRRECFVFSRFELCVDLLFDKINQIDFQYLLSALMSCANRDC